MANNLAAFTPETWSRQIVKKLNQINVLARLTNRNWEGDLSQSKTVKVRTPGNVVFSTYTPNSTSVSYQNLTPTKEDFTVSESKYFAILVDDVDAAQSDLNALSIYTDRAAVAANNLIETKLMATYTSAAIALGAPPSSTTAAVLAPVLTAGAVSSVTITSGGSVYAATPLIQFVGGDGNGATATCSLLTGVINAVTVTAGGNNYTVAPQVILTTATGIAADSSATANVGIYPLMVRARSILSRQNVPLHVGARWCVVDPDTTSLLLNDTTHFVRATDLGDNVVQYALVGGGSVATPAKDLPGFIGMVAGFMVFESSHTPVSGANKFILFGDNEAISYAGQIMKMEALRLQSSFSDVVRGLILHDTFVAAENSKRLVSIALLNTAS